MPFSGPPLRGRRLLVFVIANVLVFGCLIALCTGEAAVLAPGRRRLQAAAAAAPGGSAASAAAAAEAAEDADAASDEHGAPASPQTIARRLRRRKDIWTWDGRNVAGVVLSIAISMLSTVDREAGAAMYLVLFSVLLEFSLRQSIALTAFCTFLGSVAPGLAATSEAVATERGPLAAADYASTLLVLPGLYYGISYGVIVNAALPTWLLAMLVALFLAVSNAELLWSIGAMWLAKRELLDLAGRIKTEAQALAVVAGGDATLLGHDAADADAAAAADASTASADADDSLAAAGSAGAGRSVRRTASAVDRAIKPPPPSAPHRHVTIQADNLAGLRRRVRRLHRRAVRIEAVALLFPAFHFPTHEEAARLAGTDVDTLFGEGHGLARRAPTPAGGSKHYGTGSGGADAVSAGGYDGAGGGDGPSVHVGGGNAVEAPPAPAGRCSGLRAWGRLQPGFEWGMLFKIIVLHLITEFGRHVRAKPCTRMFWFLLCCVAALVTLLLMLVCGCYVRRRLWRGPRWASGLAEVTALQRQRREEQREEQAGAAAAAAAAAAADVEVALGDVAPAAAASAAASAAAAVKAVAAPEQEQQAGAAAGRGGCCGTGCCAGFVRWWRGHSPFLNGPASDAIKVTDACASVDGYARWTVARILVTQLVAFPAGVLNCALGFPGGTANSWLLLGLGMKPHVVAATSRFLVTAFTFGTFVAYVISGQLRLTYALAYGLINLAAAPVGMALFRKAALPSLALLTLSLAMGLAAMGAFVGVELVPALRYQALRLAGLAPTRPIEDGFHLYRFCRGHEVFAPH